MNHFKATLKRKNVFFVRPFKKGSLFSETTLTYLDEFGKFHHPISIKLSKTKKGVYCILKVMYGEYNILSGGCRSLKHSLAKQDAIQEALFNAEIEISPDLPGIDFGSEYEKKIAIAIARTLGLNPERCTFVNSGMEKLIESIRTFDSDTFSASSQNWTEEQVKAIANWLIEHWIVDKIDGYDLSEICGELGFFDSDDDSDE
jgi:hypothetical protein